jgi:hypothetical protein
MQQHKSLPTDVDMGDDESVMLGTGNYYYRELLRWS